MSLPVGGAAAVLAALAHVAGRSRRQEADVDADALLPMLEVMVAQGLLRRLVVLSETLMLVIVTPAGFEAVALAAQARGLRG